MKLGRELIPADVIAVRVARMGQQIREWYLGEPVHLVVVLRGAMIFGADLLRAIPGDDVYLHATAARSYDGTKPGKLTLTTEIPPVKDQHTLIVEDIVDTGNTALSILQRARSLWQPKTLQLVTLLDKVERREVQMVPDWTGFDIPDRFVVGYGLDYDGRYRNLPGIYILEES